jgi:hypothetical protein
MNSSIRRLLKYLLPNPMGWGLGVIVLVEGHKLRKKQSQASNLIHLPSETLPFLSFS